MALTETAPRPSVAGSLPVQDDEGQGRADERADELGDDVAAGGRPSILRVASREIVTAGLMWQPLMWPTE